MLDPIRATLARWGEAMAIFCGAKSMSILCISMLAGLKARVWQSIAAKQSLQTVQIRMGDVKAADGQFGQLNGRKKIILNAFDMSTVGHLSPGQWKVSVMQKPVLYTGFPANQFRIQPTSQPRSESLAIGLSSRSCWNGEVSMPSSWPILTAVMIPTRASSMNAFGAQPNGPSQTQPLYIACAVN